MRGRSATLFSEDGVDALQGRVELIEGWPMRGDGLWLATYLLWLVSLAADIGAVGGGRMIPGWGNMPV